MNRTVEVSALWCFPSGHRKQVLIDEMRDRWYDGQHDKGNQKELGRGDRGGPGDAVSGEMPMEEGRPQ